MSGKWHLGHEKEHRPYARGFEETFALLPGDWELFNLRHDPAEGDDLSAEKPEKLSELVSAWEEYSEKVGVVYDPIDMSIVSE